MRNRRLKERFALDVILVLQQLESRSSASSFGLGSLLKMPLAYQSFDGSSEPNWRLTVDSFFHKSSGYSKDFGIRVDSKLKEMNNVASSKSVKRCFSPNQPASQLRVNVPLIDSPCVTRRYTRSVFASAFPVDNEFKELGNPEIKMAKLGFDKHLNSGFKGFSPNGNAIEKIRPLNLPPHRNNSSKHQIKAQDYYGSGGSGGSSSPPTPPPILQASGGGWGSTQDVDVNNVPIPGQYSVKNGVPVGSMAHIVVSPPSGYIIQSVAWSGGTDVKSYFSDEASSSAAPMMQAITGVVTTSNTYDFAVDSNARTYCIFADVVYQNNSHSSSTLYFDSLRPSFASIFKDPNITPATGIIPNQTGGGIRFYDNRDIANSDGIRLLANSSTNTIYGGSFMFMQLADTVNRTYIDSNNITKTMSGNKLIDTGGPDIIGKPIGMESLDFQNPAPPFINSWTVIANTTTPTRFISDEVIVSVPDQLNDNSVQVGNSTNDGYEKYTTFLMYKPNSGVWVPLSKISWGWRGKASRNQATNVWEINTTFPSDSFISIPVTISGANMNDLWPSWTGRTNDLSWKE